MLINIKKIIIPKQIIILLTLAVVLNISRFFIFDNYVFIYIIWNIFLAFIPFLITSVLILYINKENIVKPIFIISFIIWILFLPNAPYVVTDLIHLGNFRKVPMMYDIFLLFSSAGVSLLMGLYSLFHMEKMLLLKFSKKITNIMIAFIILIASFGIYLGRFLRFNSWDFFISHKLLLSSVWDTFTLSNNNTNVFTYTLLFFFFIYMSYLSFKIKN